MHDGGFPERGNEFGELVIRLAGYRWVTLLEQGPELLIELRSWVELR